MTINETPPLALSDIMHTMSPSPAPQPPEIAKPDPPVLPSVMARSPSPEPLNQAEIDNMKKKVQEMALSSKESEAASTKEKELANMVLRLTSSDQLDSSQLLRQADTIAQLTQQRNFLMRQAEEERSRWEAEKDGWERMGEALIAQRSKGENSTYREEELAHQVAALGADNKTLKQKFHDTQSRIAQLQKELAQLRPLLLMQPLALTGPHQAPAKPSRKAKTKKPPPTQSPSHSDHHLSEDEGDVGNQASHASTSNAKGKSKADYYRRDSQTVPPSPLPPSHTKSKKSKGHKGKDVAGPSSSTPILSDARAEHLLLAARKVGRERAGILAGLTRALEVKDKDRRDEGTSNSATPKTPRRTNGQLNPAHVTPNSATSQPVHPAYAYFHPFSIGSSPTGPVLVPIPPGTYPLPQTPNSRNSMKLSSSSTSRVQPQGQRSQPHTPLESLLSAAQSMMDDEGDQSTSTPTGRNVRTPRANPHGQVRPASAIDPPESPVPKRRKVAHEAAVLRGQSSSELSSAGRSQRQSQNASPATLGRVRSALDVLADQAAVFSSKDEESGPVKGKGKGREQIQTPSTAVEDERSSRTKAKSRGKGKGRAEIIASRLPTPPLPDETPPSQEPLPGQQSPRHSNEGLPSDTPQHSDSAVGRISAVATVNSTQAVDVVAASEPAPETSIPEAPTDAQRPSPLAPPIILSSSYSDDVLDPSSQTVNSRRRSSSIPPGFPRMRSPELTLPTDTHARSETAPDIRASSPVPDSSSALMGVPPMTVHVMRVAAQDNSSRRPRSPYVKWTREEDELLTRAVAKYGQKWDQVQKALPSRGYHQVRQRWLRKMGVFDNKSEFSTGNGKAGGHAPGEVSRPAESAPNPKLGFAPLSSELAVSNHGQAGYLFAPWSDGSTTHSPALHPVESTSKVLEGGAI